MLILTGFVPVDNLLKMTVLVECDPARAYPLVVDMGSEFPAVVESGVPEEYRIYERQARTRLREYHGKPLPGRLVAAWY